MTPAIESKKHRTPEQWQAIVEQFKGSDLSAKKFCENKGIGYASFCNWRRRLSTSDTGLSEPSDSILQFIDLGSLGRLEDQRWDIVLKLGNGVELCLSQSRVSA